MYFLEGAYTLSIKYYWYMLCFVNDISTHTSFAPLVVFFKKVLFSDVVSAPQSSCPRPG